MEEKTHKAEEKARRMEEKAHKTEEKARQTAKKTACKPGEKRKGKERTNSSDSHMISTRSQIQPPQKKARVDNDFIDESECCVCFTSYEEDIVNQSGKDWVACACGRWLHKDCTDECVLDSAIEERICPFCLDILFVQLHVTDIHSFR